MALGAISILWFNGTCLSCHTSRLSDWQLIHLMKREFYGNNDNLGDFGSCDSDSGPVFI